MPNFTLSDDVFIRAAEQFPTPFHIYDEAGIRNTAQAVNAAFSWAPDFKEYFAVKALPNPAILKIFKEEGCGLDCSSECELLLAEMSGFRGDEIMFSANAMPPEEFDHARALGAIVNLDDISDIDILAAHGGIPETVCIRYNPGGDFTLGNAIMGSPGESKYGWTKEQVPVGLDTDVNAAALAEACLGAAKGKENCLYVTVGTGIGGGVIIHGKPVHGLMHPEIGHISVVPEPDDPMPRGVCPYHPHCLEGLASGPAIEKRWGKPGAELPPDHPAWELESAYLAQLCASAVLSFSPEVIILGGGVMQQKFLLPMIRTKVLQLLNGYIAHPAIVSEMESYIVEPGLGTKSGITGAFLLAREAEKECQLR